MNPDRLLLIAMYCVLGGVVLMFASNQLAGNANLGFLSPIAFWAGVGLTLVACVLALLSKRKSKDDE
jgi:hypothetical protein